LKCVGKLILHDITVHQIQQWLNLMVYFRKLDFWVFIGWTSSLQTDNKSNELFPFIQSKWTASDRGRVDEGGRNRPQGTVQWKI